ncbi:MAG TPA: YlbF family regulator [Bacilli bacterium]|jgi:cell fate (sporulation/competence/biofilm development) regulator YmcA (YheA/YmcA/DUF963 family)|nr:YlbF family regulator [Bacilli bacterium]
MNEVESKLQEVKQALYQIPEVIEFLAVRQAILQNQELSELDQKIRAAQRGMGQHLNDEHYKTHRAVYDEATAIYEAHPLVVNYRNLKEAVNLILTQMKDILSLE